VHGTSSIHRAGDHSYYWISPVFILPTINDTTKEGKKRNEGRMKNWKKERQTYISNEGILISEKLQKQISVRYKVQDVHEPILHY